MPVPYSEDLRRKIIQACERGVESQRKIAEFFSVSQSFVESVWHHYRHSGGEFVPHRRRAGRHPRLDEGCREKLRGWLEEQSDLTLQELIDRLHAATGITVSEPTMCRVLQQLGMRRKKSMVTLLFATRNFGVVVGSRKSIRRRLGEGVLRATMRVAPDGPQKDVGFKSRFFSQVFHQADVPFTSSNFFSRKTSWVHQYYSIKDHGVMPS